jgi:protein-S-isoprenylcysteine O-methyltransferase Ste14
MTELDLHHYLVLTIYIAAGCTFVALFFVTAPYGRHLRSGWGPTVAARTGWIIMESPAVLLFAWVYALGDSAMQVTPLLLLGLWQLHYIYRTFVYPFRIRQSAKRMPVSIVGMAIFFNCINAYINARWISQLGEYSASWLASPAFLLGVGIFLLGWMINQHADNVLLRLRGPLEDGYRIPHGGMYRFVSCPNYLGEMLEWMGWAIATWSMAGLAFAVFSIANLLPRAIANHRWYRDKFGDYPAARKAVIPFLL